MTSLDWWRRKFVMSLPLQRHKFVIPLFCGVIKFVIWFYDFMIVLVFSMHIFNIFNFHDFISFNFCSHQRLDQWSKSRWQRTHCCGCHDVCVRFFVHLDDHSKNIPLPKGTYVWVWRARVLVATASDPILFICVCWHSLRNFRNKNVKQHFCLISCGS